MENRVISKDAIAAAGHYVKERDYWLEKLSPAGEFRKSYFPYDYNGKATSKFFDFPGESLVKTRFTGELFTRLMEVSNGFDYTLHMIAVAVTMVLLYKYTYGSSKDIVVGVPIYKKKGNESDMEFVNTVLALRERLKDNMTFKELLFQVRKTILEADKHKNYPIEVLVSQLNITFVADDFPLFDVAVLLENIHDHDYLRLVNLNIIFSFLRTGGSIEMEVNYNPLKYEKATVERITDHFTVLLQQVLFNIDLRLFDVEILTGEEKEQLLVKFNGTAREYPRDKTVHQLFAEQVSRTPDGVAVVGKRQGVAPPADKGAVGKGERIGETVQLTYRELNQKSNQWAYLLRERGVSPDTIVGIMVERSVEMIIGILGILKAGGAYLPIDPNSPQGRIDYMLKDSGAGILLSELSEVSGRAEVIDLPLLIVENGDAGPGDLCYVIFTSGTTGNPKAVMVEHRNVVNTVSWFAGQYRIGFGTHVLQSTDCTFDPSVEQIFASLLHGASLYVISRELLVDLQGLRQFIDENQVHVINFVPMLLKELLGTGSTLASLRGVISGGDRLEEETKNIIVEKGYELFNHYGPTEITVDALSVKCSVKDRVTLGKPIANVRCYIVDKTGLLSPVGVLGELLVGGEGVGRGYLNQPELTAEKFDRDLWNYLDYHDKKNKRFLGGPGGRFFKKAPLAAGGKVYKTGDLARWLPDGNIEFLGRIDHQVKIRGYRIELSEVEYQLRTHQSVKEAVVIAGTGKGEDKYLCAYFVPCPGEAVDIGALKQHLLARLPAYMVPRYMVQLEQIPLTPNGKIDRKTLPEPGDRDRGLEVCYVKPGTDEEKNIAAIWREVLNLEKVGIHDNFFDLGGNSLGVIMISRRLGEIFNRNVPTAVIFLNPTIHLLARHFSLEVTGEDMASEQVEIDRSEVIDEGRGRLRNRLQRMEVGN